jgi:hypothetical protein
MKSIRWTRLRGSTWLACVSLAAVIVGCDETGPVKQASKQLAKADLPAPTPPIVPRVAAASGSTTPVLHIDGSQSMAGFANCMRSPTAFDNVLDRLTVGLGITSVSRFGDVGAAAIAGGERMPLSRAPHCPEFYSYLQNPDYRLYEAIAADTSGATHLYLTDGVQSDVAGTNQSPSVQSLARWLEGGNALAVLAFRSHFEGRAWSETRKQWIGHVAVEQRPFYVFAFARSEASMDATLRRLPPSVLDSAVVMRFAPDAINCTTTAGKISKESEDRALSWIMIRKSVTAQMRTQAKPVVEYECRIRREYPLSAVRARVAGVRYGRWTGAKFTFPVDVPAGVSFNADSTTTTADGSKTIVQAVTGDDATTRFGFFALRLAPEPGALRPRIVQLSTDADAQAGDYDRTYRFAWVVEQLARAQVARVVPDSRFYLTTYYR